MGIKGAVYGKGYAAYLRLVSFHKGTLSGSQSRTATPARSAKPVRMACHSFGSCIFDGEAVKSAFLLLLTKVTKPSQRNLLSRAVAGTRYG